MYHYVVLLLVTQLFVAPCIQALGILLPLYVYPGSNCASWAPVSNAISAQSSAKWYIIINPDSGPGKTDQTYQTCVSKIPASNGQIIMGFIDTRGGNVEGDIDTYAGWDSAARPVGIFFDNISPTANQLSTYQGYASYARSKGFTFIGLDPGQTTDASYFSMADLVNTYEDSYSGFNANSLSGSTSKQSVILVNAPSSGSYSTVINQLEAAGAAAVYISDVSDNQQDLPVQLSEFASEVAGTGGSTAGSPPSDPSTPSSPADPSSPSSPSSPNSANPNPSNPNSSSDSNPISGTGSTNPSSASAASSSKATTSIVKGGIATTPTGSTQLPQSSTAGGDPTQASASSKHGPPIGAIVGAVLGVLIILVLLALFLCLRRRRRRQASVAPFPIHNEASPVAITIPSDLEAATPAAAPQRQSWPADVKVPISDFASTDTDPEMSELASPSTSNYGDTARLSAAPTYGSGSTRDRNPNPRVSAAPTYGSAWESLAGSTGPPPSYHN